MTNCPGLGLCFLLPAMVTTSMPMSFIGSGRRTVVSLWSPSVMTEVCRTTASRWNGMRGNSSRGALLNLQSLAISMSEQSMHIGASVNVFQSSIRFGKTSLDRIMAIVTEGLLLSMRARELAIPLVRSTAITEEWNVASTRPRFYSTWLQDIVVGAWCGCEKSLHDSSLFILQCPAFCAIFFRIEVTLPLRWESSGL